MTNPLEAVVSADGATAYVLQHGAATDSVRQIRLEEGVLGATAAARHGGAIAVWPSGRTPVLRWMPAWPR